MKLIYPLTTQKIATRLSTWPQLALRKLISLRTSISGSLAVLLRPVFFQPGMHCTILNVNTETVSTVPLEPDEKRLSNSETTQSNSESPSFQDKSYGKYCTSTVTT